MPITLLVQLSWRNIWRHRRRNAILLSAIAIAVTGVMLLNMMMRGMQQDLMNTAIENLTGHVKILAPGYRDDPGIARGFGNVEGWESALPGEVQGWAERIRVPAVVTSERETRGIQLLGVDPARESISFLGDATVDGERLAGPGDSRLLVGALLAEALDTMPGRRLVLVTQGADGRNREAGFRIAGVYRAEIAGLEKAFVFTGLESLQRLLGTDQITEISIRLDHEDLEAPTIAGLTERLEHLKVLSWRTLEPQAASMVEISDLTIYIMFVIVMGALVFGLVNTLVTAVMERLRELGMLRAIGMRPRVVVAQVVVESSIIMTTGVAAGLMLAGAVFAFVADGIDLTAFDDSLASFGMRPTFVPVFAFRDVVLVVGLSLALSVVASFYPARRAVKIEPLEALRR